MDDLRIYNRSLSQGEIQALFQGQEHHRADTDPPFGCITMDEMVGFMELWKLDSTEYPMREMMGAVSLWKSGEGC